MFHVKSGTKRRVIFGVITLLAVGIVIAVACRIVIWGIATHLNRDMERLCREYPFAGGLLAAGQEEISAQYPPVSPNAGPLYVKIPEYIEDRRIAAVSNYGKSLFLHTDAPEFLDELNVFFNQNEDVFQQLDHIAAIREARFKRTYIKDISPGAEISRSRILLAFRMYALKHYRASGDEVDEIWRNSRHFMRHLEDAADSFGFLSAGLIAADRAAILQQRFFDDKAPSDALLREAIVSLREDEAFLEAYFQRIPKNNWLIYELAQQIFAPLIMGATTPFDRFFGLADLRLLRQRHEMFRQAVFLHHCAAGDLYTHRDSREFKDLRQQALRSGVGSFNTEAGLLEYKAGITGQLRATAGGFAIELYRRKYGKCPMGWDALIPEFLSEVPRDPGDGKPFQFGVESADITFRDLSQIKNNRELREEIRTLRVLKVSGNPLYLNPGGLLTGKRTAVEFMLPATK
jgi:hypothetical protein